MLLNLYEKFEEYNLPWLTPYNESVYYSDSKMIKPAIDLLQKNVNILSLIDDIEGYINKIAFDEIIEIISGDYSYILTESDKMDFLSIIGNIIGLRPFSMSTPDGFILDIDKLDINRLGGGGDIKIITSREYARCILARILKFYGVASIDNIYDSIVYVSQADPENVSASFSLNTITFTISSTNPQRTELFIEYIDQYGYNLWIKPTYGSINFNYMSI